MKIILTNLFCVLFFNALFAQTPYKSYYSNSGNPYIFGDSETSQGRNGSFKIYSEDGRFVKKLNYHNGKLQGLVTIMLDNKKVLEGYFENNKKTDMWTTYFASGQKSSQGAYLEGEKIGTWRFYHTNGKLCRLVNYRNGEVNGNWTFYNENGDLIEHDNYDKLKAEHISFALDNIWNPQMQMSNSVFLEKSKQIDFVKNVSKVDKAIQVEYIAPAQKEIFETDSIHSLIIPFFVPENGEFNLLFEYPYKIESWFVFTVDGIGVANFFSKYKINKDKYTPFISRLKSLEKAYIPYMYISFNSNGQFIAEDMRGKLCFLRISVKKENMSTFKQYYLQMAYNMFSVKNGAQEMFDYNYYLSYLSGTIQENYGVIKSYYDDGTTLKTKTSYSTCVANGPEISYNKDGSIKSKGAYLNRFKDGEWLHFYDNTRYVYNWKKGIKEGSFYEYEFDKLVERGQYLNDQKTGEWKTFYSSGKLNSVGVYKNDLKIGNWKYYYENGQLSAIYPYENGNINGDVVQYHKNGELRLKYTSVNSNENGEIIEYYDNGNIFSKGNAAKGLKIGKWEYFYDNGSIYMTGTFDAICSSNPNKYVSFNYPIKSGEWKVFTKENKLSLVNIYSNCGNVLKSVNFNDTTKNAYLELRSENDSLLSQTIINTSEIPKDINLSEVTSYTFNIEKGDFKASIKTVGSDKLNHNINFESIQTIRFSESNNVVSAIQFKKGLKSGNWKTYYSNDSVECSLSYVNNKLEGESYIFFNNGKIKKSAQFLQDELHGVYTEYLISGEKTKHAYYTNGLLNGESTFYYDNGNVKLVIEYKDGKKHGDEKHYSFNGKLLSHRIYVNGIPVNEWINYYDNGNVKVKGSFVNGLRNGEWIVFSDTGNKQQVLTWEMGYLVKVKTYKSSYKLEEGTFKKGSGTVNHYKRNGSIDTYSEFINGIFYRGNEYWSIGNASL